MRDPREHDLARIRNLGRETVEIAAKMTVYNPDATWKKPEPQ